MSKDEKFFPNKTGSGDVFIKDISGDSAWVVVEAPDNLSGGLKISVLGEADRETNEIFKIGRDIKKKITLIHNNVAYEWTGRIRPNPFNSWENPLKIFLRRIESS